LWPSSEAIMGTQAAGPRVDVALRISGQHVLRMRRPRPTAGVIAVLRSVQPSPLIPGLAILRKRCAVRTFNLGS